MIAMRLRFRVVGGHVHCRLFAGMVPDGFQPGGYTLSKAGDLVFRGEEWPDVRVTFECGGVDVLGEEEDL